MNTNASYVKLSSYWFSYWLFTIYCHLHIASLQHYNIGASQCIVLLVGHRLRAGLDALFSQTEDYVVDTVVHVLSIFLVGTLLLKELWQLVIIM